MREIPVVVFSGISLALNSNPASPVAAAQTSKAYSGAGIRGVSVVANITNASGLSGTLQLKVCNEPPGSQPGVSPTQGQPSGSAFFGVPPDPNATVAISGNGAVTITCDGPWRWYELVYAPAAGTGTMTAQMYAWGGQ